jgi:hypothetical protein
MECPGMVVKHLYQMIRTEIHYGFPVVDELKESMGQFGNKRSDGR